MEYRSIFQSHNLHSCNPADFNFQIHPSDETHRLERLDDVAGHKGGYGPVTPASTACVSHGRKSNFQRVTQHRREKAKQSKTVKPHAAEAETRG